MDTLPRATTEMEAQPTHLRPGSYEGWSSQEQEAWGLLIQVHSWDGEGKSSLP